MKFRGITDIDFEWQATAFDALRTLVAVHIFGMKVAYSKEISFNQFGSSYLGVLCDVSGVVPRPITFYPTDISVAWRAIEFIKFNNKPAFDKFQESATKEGVLGMDSMSAAWFICLLVLDSLGVDLGSFYDNKNSPQS